jgi:hypothetical protein
MVVHTRHRAGVKGLHQQRSDACGNDGHAAIDVPHSGIGPKVADVVTLADFAHPFGFAFGVARKHDEDARAVSLSQALEWIHF